jgi:hypothetical protein
MRDGPTGDCCIKTGEASSDTSTQKSVMLMMDAIVLSFIFIFTLEEGSNHNREALRLEMDWKVRTSTWANQCPVFAILTNSDY